MFRKGFATPFRIHGSLLSRKPIKCHPTFAELMSGLRVPLVNGTYEYHESLSQFLQNDY